MNCRFHSGAHLAEFKGVQPVPVASFPMVTQKFRKLFFLPKISKYFPARLSYIEERQSYSNSRQVLRFQQVLGVSEAHNVMH